MWRSTYRFLSTGWQIIDLPLQSFNLEQKLDRSKEKEGRRWIFRFFYQLVFICFSLLPGEHGHGTLLLNFLKIILCKVECETRYYKELWHLEGSYDIISPRMGHKVLQLLWEILDRFFYTFFVMTFNPRVYRDFKISKQLRLLVSSLIVIYIWHVVLS